MAFGDSISTPWDRALSKLHFQLADHAFLRVLWTNLDEIAPGVWRSNQPSQRRIRKYKAMGIKTILNLRGTPTKSFHLFEKEAAENLGLEMINMRLAARALMPREVLLDLLDVFETIQKPFVMHCKSGADRAGLASALWLLHMEDAPIEAAQQQLSFRYVHLRATKTGILDHFLAAYASDIAAEPMPIREWIETRYDPQALTASFKPRLPVN